MSFSTAATAALLLAGQAAEPTISSNLQPSAFTGTSAPDLVEPVIVQAPLLYPSAGLMNDDMHSRGEVMIGLRFESSRLGGSNRRGNDPISDEAIVAAGYSSRTRSMTMDMVMLDLMAAPHENVTLMVMPHYMRHRMVMVGIDPNAGHAGHGEHGGHALGLGESHKHMVKGFGDTLASASFRLARQRRFAAQMTLGLWVPTGSSSRKSPDGRFVHYGMQPGSGTWDAEPSLTISGRAGRFGWGAQGAYRWRITEANASGFRFGDKAKLNGWASYLLRPSLGATARLEYAQEGSVEGHYNGAHNHSAPPDRQENYGGKTISAGLGLNWQLPLKGLFRPEVGIEAGLPLYQKLNGIQAPQDWRLATAVRHML